MGGRVVVAKFERVAGAKARSLRWLREELWHKLNFNIRLSMSSDDTAHAPYMKLYNDEQYVARQRRSWKMAEGELTFAFSDHAGMLHASAGAWAHWTARKLACFAVTRKQDFASDLRIALKAPSTAELLADGEIVCAHEGRVFLAARDAEGVHLVGDGSDVTNDALSAAARREIRKLLDAKRCPCPVCGELRRLKPKR